MKIVPVMIVALTCVLSAAGCAESSPRPTVAAVTKHAHVKPKHVDSVFVPNIVNEHYSSAYDELTTMGFEVLLNPPAAAPDANRDAYKVTSQAPAGNSNAEPGSTIVLQLAPLTITVPNLVGETYSEAQTNISDLPPGSLTLSQSTHSDWIVKTQSPAADAVVSIGSKIAITLIEPLIVLRITGNGSSSNVITYTIPGTFNIEQATDARLPWSKSFSSVGVDSDGYISAQDEYGTSITCTITDNGRVVDQHTSTGRYAIVQCGG